MELFAAGLKRPEVAGAVSGARDVDGRHPKPAPSPPALYTVPGDLSATIPAALLRTDVAAPAPPTDPAGAADPTLAAAVVEDRATCQDTIEQALQKHLDENFDAGTKAAGRDLLHSLMDGNLDHNLLSTALARGDTDLYMRHIAEAVESAAIITTQAVATDWESGM